MKYPINEDVMVSVYKEQLAVEGSEFNEHDDKYIRRITMMVNQAYVAGVQDGLNACDK